MRTRTRVLGAVTALAAAPFASAQVPAAPTAPAVLPQTLPAAAPVKSAAPVQVKPMDPVPVRPGGLPQAMPAPQGKEKEGQEGKAPPPPPVTQVLPLTAPTAAPVPACVGCGEAASPAAPEAGDRPRIVPNHKGVPTAAWMNVSFGLTWLKPQPLPFPVAVQLVNGQPTQTLLGETTLGTKHHDGIRIDGGTWTDDCHTVGFGFGGLLVEHRSREQSIRTDGTAGSPTIARPFTDAVTGLPNNLLVGGPAVNAGPAVGSGAVALVTTSRLSGLEGNFRRNLHHGDNFDVDFFLGARYLDLDESLTIYQSTTPFNNVTVGQRDAANNGTTIAVPAGSTINLVDRVYTRNQFYGGEVGLKAEYRHGILFASMTPRVGFGPVHQVTYIDGNTNAPGLANPTSGGLLAVGLPTAGYSGPTTDGNIGRNVSNRFAVLTEMGFALGLQLTQSARLSVGYNFLYLSNTARPANQLDTTINSRLVPTSPSFGTLSGPSNPRLTFDREDFYAHGVTLTLGLQY